MADEKGKEVVQVSNKYDGIQVKHTLDDEVNRFFSKDEKYVTNHRHADTKLALGFLSCIAAGGAFAYEYVHGFDNSKPIMLCGVIAFWVFQSLLWLYTSVVERQQVFVGTKRDASKQKEASLIVSTELDKFSPMYEVSFDYYDMKQRKKANIKLKQNVASWLSDDGVLNKDVMDKDLRNWLQELASKTHTN